MASMIAARDRGVGHPDLIQRVGRLVPYLVVFALFKLTINGAGWELDSLTLVQTSVFVLFGVVVWTGGIRPVAVARPLLGVVLAVGLSAIWSIRPEASVRALIMWLMYGGIFIIIASTLTVQSHATRIVDGALAIGAWICLIAVAWGRNADMFGSRWYASFYWPNPFAAFLLLLIPVAAIRFLHARTRNETVAHGIITSVLLVAFIMTYSRGAWVALAGVSLLAVALIRLPSTRVALRRVGVIIGIVALATVLLAGRVDTSAREGFFDRAASMSNPGNESIQGRLSFWRSAMGIFRDHPIVGTGPWTYGIATTRYQDDVRFYSSDAHNFYLQTAAEMGIVGLMTLAILLASVVALWIRTLRLARGTAEYPIVAGVGLGLIGFFLHSALDLNWAFPANPALAFAMIGVLAGYEGPFQRPAPLSTRPLAVGLRIAATLVVGLAIALTQMSRVAQHAYVEGMRLVDSGQLLAGTTELARARQWNPLHPDYVMPFALAASQTSPQAGDEIVRDGIHRARALDQMNATYLVQEAILLMTQAPKNPARAQAAEALLQQALVLDRFNDPSVYRILAQLYLRQGRADDAAAVYQTALSLYLGHSLGRGGFFYQDRWRKVVVLVIDDAELAVRRGHPDHAVEVLRAALREDPGAIPVAVRLSALYTAMGRAADARIVLTAAAVRSPDSPEIRAALDALR